MRAKREYVQVVWMVVCLSILGARPLAARVTASPPGYFVDSTQAVAERADKVAADGDFTISIHRHYEDATGARLLAIAEATYPPRDRLVNIAIERGFEMGSDSARVPLWWCDGPGATRVPYAITAGAIEHYTRLTERFRSHQFREAWAHHLWWSDLDYRAKIEHRDEYVVVGGTIADVYVAEMTLSWQFDDGILIPASVAHRVVVLTRDGTVIGVEGDGETVEQVFFSSHRAPGRVDAIMR